MKKFISRIRNKRLKGNVSLLVILILLASSVIALLSINQIQHLITYWNMTFNYFRAFYLAKAWTELGLTEVYYREAWFRDSVKSWDAIVTKNLGWDYPGFNSYFNMDITWNFQRLTNDVRYTTKDDCKGSNKITLGTWEWIMLSLFRDTTSWITNILTLTPTGNINKNIEGLNNDDIKQLKMESLMTGWSFQYFTFWLFDYNDAWDMWNIIVHTWNDLKSFLWSNIGSIWWKRRYLTIKNPWTGSETASFCITMGEKLIPYSNSLITVRGNYGDMEVWLQSVVNKTAPSWALNVLGL